MRVIVACDSFKGSLTSRQAGDTVMEGVLSVLPGADVTVIQLADGGEGTLDAIASFCYGAVRYSAGVTGPEGIPVEGDYLMLDSRTACIESARACGLCLSAGRDAMRATSRGVGELILAALDRGADTFIIGLGGTASTDGGTGMARALGARFFDGDGHELPEGGGGLACLAGCDLSQLDSRLSNCSFKLMSDVASPLLGPMGAAALFGPQKGASTDQVKILDDGLTRLADLLGMQTDARASGAAGGLGAMLVHIFGAKVVSGIDYMLDLCRFDELIRGADIVVTGEGMMDSTTRLGKLPAGVLSRCRTAGIPVVAFAGRVVDRSRLLECGFLDAVQITPDYVCETDALNPMKAAMRLSDAAAGWFSGK